MENKVCPLKYPVIVVYAVDWNQYLDQHNPKHIDYAPANGWIGGFLIEETDKHIALALTSFDSGDVRDLVVVPKCTIIQRNEFELKHGDPQ